MFFNLRKEVICQIVVTKKWRIYNSPSCKVTRQPENEWRHQSCAQDLGPKANLSQSRAPQPLLITLSHWLERTPRTSRCFPTSLALIGFRRRPESLTFQGERTNSVSNRNRGQSVIWFEADGRAADNADNVQMHYFDKPLEVSKMMSTGLPSLEGSCFSRIGHAWAMMAINKKRSPRWILLFVGHS